MKLIRKVRLWFYLRIKGHLPPGTLVRFMPKEVAWIWRVNYSLDPGAVGIVLGGWRYYRSPGYTDFGTRVMFSEQIRDVYHWDLEVIDEI